MITRIKIDITIFFMKSYARTFENEDHICLWGKNRNCNAVNEKYSSFNGIADQHAIACLSKSSCHAIWRRLPRRYWLEKLGYLNRRDRSCKHTNACLLQAILPDSLTTD